MLIGMILGFFFIQAMNKSECTVQEQEKYRKPCLVSNLSRTSGLDVRVDCIRLNLTSVPACSELKSVQLINTYNIFIVCLLSSW